MGGGAKLDSFNIDLIGLVVCGRGVDLRSLSLGELETPVLGISWKVGGNGEKPTFWSHSNQLVLLMMTMQVKIRVVYR